MKYCCTVGYLDGPKYYKLCWLTPWKICTILGFHIKHMLWAHALSNLYHICYKPYVDDPEKTCLTSFSYITYIHTYYIFVCNWSSTFWKHHLMHFRGIKALMLHLTETKFWNVTHTATSQVRNIFHNSPMGVLQ